MATTTFLANGYITIGGVDFSDQAQNITLTVGKESLDFTAFGDTGRKMYGGLKSCEVTADLFISYGAGEVEATLAGLVGAGTTTVVIRPTSAAASATNPQYTISNMMLENFTPINSTVGELAVVSITLTGGTDVRSAP